MPGEPPGCQKPERHPAAIREEAAGTAAVASWPAARQTATGLTHDGVCVSVCACACHVAQSDPEGPIRVNTVILLGRIAPLLRADTRDAVRAGDGCQHATHAHDVSIACLCAGCVAVSLHAGGHGCVCESHARPVWSCTTRCSAGYSGNVQGLQQCRTSVGPRHQLLDCGRGAGEPVLTLVWHRLWVGCADAMQAVVAPCVPHDGGSVGGCSQRGVPTHGCDDGALLGGCHAAYHAA